MSGEHAPEHASEENRARGEVRRRGALDAALALGLGVSAAFAVVVTLRSVGLSFDEPANIRYQKQMGRWFRLALTGGDGVSFRRALDPRVFTRYWAYETARHRHPPMAGYLANFAWWLFRDWMEEPWCYRLSSAVLFGLVVGLVYWEGSRAWGRLAGVTSAASLVLMPRVFGHAHMAVTDTPSMVFWFLCWVAFRGMAEGRGGGCRRVGRAVLFGAVLGASLLVRFTNWLVVVPMAGWVLRFRRRSRARWWHWAAAGVTAAGVAVALDPAWWRDPPAGIYLFLEKSLTRADFAPIPTYFLGRTYRMALPWYNAPLLTAAVTPAAVLAAFVAGLAAALRRRLAGGLEAFAVFSIFTLWGARALPFAPGHDGIRLFLPVFPFVALLAGRGTAAAARAFGRPRLAGALLLVAVTAGAGYQLLRCHPYYLSYYSEVVGGPRGARRLGLETTYWWETADEYFLAMLNRDLPRGAHLYTIPMAPTLRYWQRTGRLRKDIVLVSREEDFPEIGFLVLLCRQGWFDPAGEAPARKRPRGYSAEAVWRWYREWRRQWRVYAPWREVPFIIVVRHGPGGAGPFALTPRSREANVSRRRR